MIRSYDTSVKNTDVFKVCFLFWSEPNGLGLQSFGAPYSSRRRNQCSVFVLKIQPNSECQEAGMTFGAVKAMKQLALEVYVSAQ